MMRLGKLALAAVGLAALPLLPVSPAKAEMVVIRSSGGALKPGQTIASEATVTLPPGQSATLLSQDGKSVTLTGPYSGTPEASPTGGDPGVLKALSRLLTQEAGDTTALGVTRGTGIRDPYAIDLGGGLHCQVADKQPYFVRADSSGDFHLTIIAATGSESIATWRPGSARASWPDDLPFENGAYLIRSEDHAQPVRLTVRRLPAGLEDPAAVSAWMAEHGCPKQALALINTLP